MIKFGFFFYSFYFLRLIGRELDEVILKERLYKYVKDIYYIIWDEQDQLKPKKPEPTNQERQEMKEEALRQIKDIIPGREMKLDA